MSPIGELRFTIMFDEFDKTFGGVFPSPIGELNFSIATRTGRKFGKMTCFRPLSGSYISQCKRKTKGENHEQFPSPIGELHFSIDELIPIARDIQCFRPLSGSYISQSPEQFCQYISDRFRPLSGSYISQCSESFNPEVITFCFRPLSGSYISQ